MEQNFTSEQQELINALHSIITNPYFLRRNNLIYFLASVIEGQCVLLKHNIASPSSLRGKTKKLITNHNQEVYLSACALRNSACHTLERERPDQLELFGEQSDEIEEHLNAPLYDVTSHTIKAIVRIQNIDTLARLMQKLYYECCEYSSTRLKEFPRDIADEVRPIFRFSDRDKLERLRKANNRLAKELHSIAPGISFAERAKTLEHIIRKYMIIETPHPND